MSNGAIALAHVIPVLRIFDVGKAREFYVGFLGFSWDWEHRFEEKLPLYAQISRSDIVLHLSEHHGDACPGAAVRVVTTGIDALHREVTARGYSYARPGIEDAPWGAREMTVTDPFGNRLTFSERT